MQYIFAAGSSAAVEPLLGAIGAGWTFTICMLLVFMKIYPLADDMIGVFLSLAGGGLVWVITKWGLDMQQWVERKLRLDLKPEF